MDLESYLLLRQKISTKICGGEIVTNAAELCERFGGISTTSFNPTRA